METTRYQDGCIEIEIHTSYLIIHQTSEDFYVSIDYEEADKLLIDWSPLLKERGSFMCNFRNKVFRSYDVKSIIRLLRQILNSHRKS